MSERPNYAEECQVDPDCRNPRVRSEPACALHLELARYREVEGERDRKQDWIDTLEGERTTLVRKLSAAEATITELRAVLELVKAKIVVANSERDGAIRRSHQTAHRLDEVEQEGDAQERRADAAEATVERYQTNEALLNLHQRWLAFTMSPDCVTGTPSWINLDDARRIVAEWLAAALEGTPDEPE